MDFGSCAVKGPSELLDVGVKCFITESQFLMFISSVVDLVNIIGSSIHWPEIECNAIVTSLHGSSQLLDWAGFNKGLTLLWPCKTLVNN